MSRPLALGQNNGQGLALGQGLGLTAMLRQALQGEDGVLEQAPQMVRAEAQALASKTAAQVLAGSHELAASQAEGQAKPAGSQGTAGAAAAGEALAEAETPQAATSRPVAQAQAGSDLGALNQGLAQTEETLPARSVLPGYVVRQVGQQMAQMVARQENSLRLELKPPSLGEVSLELSVKDGVVKATMLTDTVAAKNILESGLEQLTKISKSLEGISSLPDAMAQSQALGYLGKDVTFSGNQILATDDQVSSSSYTLASAASVKVIVQNSSGQTVYEKDLGQQTAGAHDFQWNGYTDAGQVAPNGTYTLYVVGTDSQGNAVKVSDQQITARVTGYQKGTDGKGYLMVGTNTLALDKVVAVKQPATTTTSSQTSGTSDSSLTDSALAYIKSLLGLSS
ncbi:MAG: flagellar hook-length control protein FliK [Desulfarculus sp.]|nr:flagellar hook-length control protein FliK [Desulfarculus sp.]